MLGIFREIEGPSRAASGDVAAAICGFPKETSAKCRRLRLLARSPLGLVFVLAHLTTRKQRICAVCRNALLVPLCAIMRAHGAYNCANSPPVCPLARQIGSCLTRTKFALRTLIVLKLFRNRVPLAKGDERGFSKQGGYPPCVPK